MEERILTFLREWSRPYCPTLREIADALGVTSISAVSYHLSRLRTAGIVDWVDGQPRTLHLVPR